MKTLIISDTHGSDKNLKTVLENEKDIGLMIHLGDLCGLEDYIEEMTGVPCYMVRGNNDYRSNLPAESVIMLGKHRTLLTHGHYFVLDSENADLRRYASEIDCDIVMYGHTHIPQIETIGGITVINPGSLSLPRQAERLPSYIIAETDEDGEVRFEQRYLNRRYVPEFF